MNRVLSFILTVGVAIAAMSSANAAYVKCAQFKTQKEAQAYFDAKKRGYKSLDRDKDGVACEALR